MTIAIDKKKVRMRAAELDLSFAQVADLAGISRGAFYNLLDGGNFTRDTLAAICSALGVSMLEILTETADAEPGEDTVRVS